MGSSTPGSGAHQAPGHLWTATACAHPLAKAPTPYQLSCAPWWMKRLRVLHPSTSSRIFLRLIILVACCRRWRMSGMMGYPPLDQPGSRYPGLPSPALMGAPEALVAGPVFWRGLAGEGGKQVCSGQRRWAASPSRLLQRSTPESGVSREAREDQIPASSSPRPYLRTAPDNLVLGGITGSGCSHSLP